MAPLVAALVLLVLAGACRPRPPAPAAPGFTLGDSVTSADIERVVGYVGTLEFDTLHGAGDEQLLHHDPCPPCAHGPRAAIFPVKQAHRFTRSELAQGRVVAMLVNRDTIAYDRYGLAPRAVVHWWVDSSSAGWRSRFVRVSPERGVVTADLQLDVYREPRWYQGVARWLQGSEEIAWTVCGDRGCCRSDGAELSARD